MALVSPGLIMSGRGEIRDVARPVTYPLINEDKSLIPLCGALRPLMFASAKAVYLTMQLQLNPSLNDSIPDGWKQLFECVSRAAEWTEHDKNLDDVLRKTK